MQAASETYGLEDQIDELKSKAAGEEALFLLPMLNAHRQKYEVDPRCSLNLTPCGASVSGAAM
jgi:hypothetical protein